MKTRERLLLATAVTVCLNGWPSSARADALDVWNSRASTVTNALEDDACGNGVCVVAGSAGLILSSSDGIVWTRRSSGTTSFLNSMVFANGLFVVVGESGMIVTSTNGVNWVRRTSGTTDYLYDVSYGQGKFIAVSDTGAVLTSSNGNNWSLHGGSTNVYGVAYGNGRFVAVGGTVDCSFFGCFNNSVAYWSVDGLTWTKVSPAPAVLLSDLAFGNGVFVAVGEAGTILTSANGANWAPQSSGSSDFLLNVAFGEGTFVVVGAQQGTILTSTDGINWTPRNSGTFNGLFNVDNGDGYFFPVGDLGTILQSLYIGPPVLGAPRFLINGSLEIPVRGRVDRDYRLQRATNLSVPATWVDLQGFSQTDETQTLVDSGAGGFPSRYYRVAPSP